MIKLTALKNSIFKLEDPFDFLASTEDRQIMLRSERLIEFSTQWRLIG